MLIDNRLCVRNMRAEDEQLPCTGNAGMMATLEVFGRPILRGNRSRVVLIAGELEARLEMVVGRLDAHVVRFRVPAEEATRTWETPAPGKIHVIRCFGDADLFSVSRRWDKSATVSTALLGSGEEILFGLRSHVSGAAEVVLVVEVPK